MFIGKVEKESIEFRRGRGRDKQKRKSRAKTVGRIAAGAGALAAGAVAAKRMRRGGAKNLPGTNLRSANPNSLRNRARGAAQGIRDTLRNKSAQFKNRKAKRLGPSSPGGASDRNLRDRVKKAGENEKFLRRGRKASQAATKRIKRKTNK